MVIKPEKIKNENEVIKRRKFMLLAVKEISVSNENQALFKRLKAYSIN